MQEISLPQQGRINKQLQPLLLLTVHALTISACGQSEPGRDVEAQHQQVMNCGEIEYTDPDTGVRWAEPQIFYPHAILDDLRRLGQSGVQLASSCAEASKQIRFVESHQDILEDIDETALEKALISDQSIQPGLEPEFRIWDGRIAYSLDAPIVRMRFPGADGKPKAQWPSCTGTIISKEHVLTSAHCVARPGPQVIDVSTRRDTLDSKALVDVSIHPRYRGKHQTTKLERQYPSYDLAIVQFFDPDEDLAVAKESRGKMRIFVGSNKRRESRRLRGTGFRNEFGGAPLPGVTDMPQRDEELVIKRVSANYFSSTATARVRICRADSGGPAIIMGPGFPKIAGVTSLSTNLGTRCSKVGSVMYWATLRNARTWIERTVERALPDACSVWGKRPSERYLKCWD